MLFFEVLFENECILAVNKKSGVPAHSLKKDHNASLPQTVEAQVLKSYPTVQILHRLDTGTSGVLLFAKNDSIFKEMRNKFKLKDIKKIYVAWSRSEPFLGQIPFTIDHSLGHHPKSAKRMVVVEDSKRTTIRGKAFPAITHVQKVEHVKWKGSPLVQITLQIETGVTHQIRVHLKHVGCPLIGDSIYNRGECEANPEFRLGLHAQSVEFGLGGFQYKIEAPLPKSLLK